MKLNPCTSSSAPDASMSGRWRAARRLLVAAGAAATLLAVCYTVENWRGRLAWEKCRRQLEAQGEVLDWAAYVPAPVPDDQNILKAPRMREWFGEESPSAKSFGVAPDARVPNAPGPFTFQPPKATNLLIAEVRIAAPNAPASSPPADAVLPFNDPAARERAAKLLSDWIGPYAICSRPWGLVARPLAHTKPLRLVLRADAVPSAREVAGFFPANPLTNCACAWTDARCVWVDAAAGGLFRLFLTEPFYSAADYAARPAAGRFRPSARAGALYSAADYLAWTEPLTAGIELVRKALERPSARLDGDYGRPFPIPISAFIRVRSLARILSERAQCRLLLGQPEAAWQDLSLLHDSCRLLGAQIHGKPMTLVAAMIDSAISGMYLGVIEDGLRLRTWREPQLLALERQLGETDLLAALLAALRQERAVSCHTIETMKRGELAALCADRFPGDSLGGIRNLMRALLLTWMPRGWYYQNLAVGAEVTHGFLGCVDAANQLVSARQIDARDREFGGKFRPRSPYTFLAAPGIPNFLKAMEMVAARQTRINQCRLACALERHRLANGQYPETLDALAPQFIDRVPHDLIGGQPLKYRRTAGGGYVLYSIGWDETDHGGIPGKTLEAGDWVWELP